MAAETGGVSKISTSAGNLSTEFGLALTFRVLQTPPSPPPPPLLQVPKKLAVWPDCAVMLWSKFWRRR